MSHIKSVPCHFIEYHYTMYNRICVGMVPLMFCLHIYKIYIDLLLYTHIHIYIYICNVDLTVFMGFSPPTCVVLPIPVVLISVASRHEHYLIRHSFDADNPLYDQVKA